MNYEVIMNTSTGSNVNVSKCTAFMNSAKKSIMGVSKKYLLRITILGGLIIAASSYSASAQIFVKVRPAAPVVVRTTAPSPRHVWIGEEWTVRNGVYVHTGGYWALPPHPGWVWISGHWIHDRRGEQWVPGHWARR